MSRMTTTKTESLFETTPMVKLKGTELFRAIEFFTRDNKKVKISTIWQTFADNFLEIEEHDVPEGVLIMKTLAKPSTDPPIKKELGPERRAYLSDLAEALSLQPNGEAGALHTDGRANIFYIPGMEGFAVCAHWNGLGWRLFAGPVSNPFPWDAGTVSVSASPLTLSPLVLVRSFLIIRPRQTWRGLRVLYNLQRGNPVGTVVAFPRFLTFPSSRIAAITVSARGDTGQEKRRRIGSPYWWILDPK